ncbi:MAG: IPT/TIG domain-containing protein, partial [Planctomycetota bacterium]
TYLPIPPIQPPIVTAIFPASGGPQPQGTAHDFGLERLMVVGDWFDGDTTLNGGFELLLPDGQVVESVRAILHNRNLIEVYTPRLPAPFYPLSSDLLAGVRVRNVVGHADFANAMVFTATPDAGLPPILTQICPESGPVSGGNSVLVIGENFDTSSQVRFGAAASADVQFVNANLLIARAPAGAGVVPVTVADEGQISGSRPYAYGGEGSEDACPILGALNPDRGSSTGGYSILAYGVGLTPTTEIEFGAGDGNFSPERFFVSDLLLRVEVPEAFPAQIGATVQVGATDPLNGCDEAIKTVDFTYVAAQQSAPEVLFVTTTVVDPITPTVHPALNSVGGDRLLAVGANFDQATTFDFQKPQGGVNVAPAADVRVLTPNIAVMTAPASPDGQRGVADFQAHNAFGDSNEFAVEYVAPPPPTILDVRNLDDGTQTAPIDGNRRLLIFGDGFFDSPAGTLQVHLTGPSLASGGASDVTVTLSGADVTLVEDHLIGVNVPAATFTEGPLGIVVETSFGSDSFEDEEGDPIFLLVGPQPPSVLGVFPRVFNSSGGQEAVFFGRNFTATTEFTVRTDLMPGLVDVLSPRFVSDTVYLAVMPAQLGGMPPSGAPGMVHAEETDALLRTKISGDDFTESGFLDPLYVVVNDASPILLAVYADHGSIAGGEQVLLMGGNFLKADGTPNVVDVHFEDPLLGDIGDYQSASTADLPLLSTDPADKGKFVIVNDHTILL